MYILMKVRPYFLTTSGCSESAERGLQDRPSPSGKNKVTTKGKIETEERKQTQIPNLHCLVKVWPFLFIDLICPDPHRIVSVTEIF